jgi:hypothetical protein
LVGLGVTSETRSIDWDALVRRFGLKAGVGLAVLFVFLVGAVLIFFQASIEQGGASAPPRESPELVRAVDGIADAVNDAAGRIAAATDTDPPPLGVEQGTALDEAANYSVSPWWWVAAGLAFALLYYAFKDGAPDWAKKIVTGAGAVSAIAAAATALAGAYEAWRNAIAPRDDALAIRRFVEFVPTAPQTSVFVLPNDVSVVQGTDAKTLLTFAIPYGEASCATDASGRWRNTYPSGTSETFIRRLAAGLASCAAANTIPRVEVRGFASSSEVTNFPQCGTNNSDAANLAIANRRADEVAKLLDDIGGDSLDVDTHQWATLALMIEDREYNDVLLNNQYSSARATLTRRVEIRVRSAGACAPNAITAGAATPTPASVTP